MRGLNTQNGKSLVLTKHGERGFRSNGKLAFP
jgi:hypothetical protein